MNIDNLSNFEKDQLLRFFFYHLKPELRGTLICTYPVVYRKLLDRAVTPEFCEAVRGLVVAPVEVVPLIEFDQVTIARDS